MRRVVGGAVGLVGVQEDGCYAKGWRGQCRRIGIETWQEGGIEAKKVSREVKRRKRPRRSKGSTPASGASSEKNEKESGNVEFVIDVLDADRTEFESAERIHWLVYNFCGRRYSWRSHFMVREGQKGGYPLKSTGLADLALKTVNVEKKHGQMDEPQ
ncbi:hypothetical protein C8F04DRAFT_1190520 [Mycena alexandri]|uniref:Uncharacterized protein n=1 Tax=Mycena alexandri TaxID=1745969 RepID=A0AAD6SHY9_9AGAR|nr:hypothetical protein C8F04DRAFT_1190520 [Mycena alexandri]